MVVERISDYAHNQLVRATHDPKVFHPMMVGKKVYHERDMTFDDQPLFTQTLVDTQMTPVDTVRKDNIWHPLKTMKFDPHFKPIIYANDPELKEMAGGEN